MISFALWDAGSHPNWPPHMSSGLSLNKTWERLDCDWVVRAKKEGGVFRETDGHL